MGGNEWIRQIHRWMSTAFTLGVIINIIALKQKEPAAWVGLLAGIPLVLFLVTGLSLFARPFVASWRGGRRTEPPRTIDAR